MYYVWANYGDSCFESMDESEALDWLELDDDEIAEYKEALKRGRGYCIFDYGRGIDWE